LKFFEIPKLVLELKEISDLSKWQINMIIWLLNNDFIIECESYIYRK